MLLVITLLMAAAGCIGFFYFGLTFFLPCVFPAVWVGFGALMSVTEGLSFNPGYYLYRLSQGGEWLKLTFSRSIPKETKAELDARREREIAGELSAE